MAGDATPGAQEAILGGALANPTAPNVSAIVDSVLEYTLFYWDMDEASVAAVKNTPLDANGTTFPQAAVAQVNTWLAAGLGLDDIGNALLPYIQGGVTNLQAALTAAGAPLTYDTSGDPVIVNDSGHDLSMADFDFTYAEYGLLINNKGGRIKAESYANCFPAKWTQRVDSHWSYTGEIMSLDDHNITADKFELKGNYPNPFNPTTKIRFTNDRSSNVKVTVYARNGEKVATIMNKQVNA